MREPRIPANEPERLADLRAYEILDTEPERDYDRLAALAAAVCETPIALVSLVDANRQWFKARVGLDATQTERTTSFCAHAVADDETLVVPDALHDERFADNPLVEDDPGIRFYAGTLLRSHRGANLGTLCVIDTRPRALAPQQLMHLETIAQMVEAQLELRRQQIDIRNLRRLHEATSAPEMSYDERIRAVLRAGLTAFGVDGAIVSRIEGEEELVRYVAGDVRERAEGSRRPLDGSHSALVLEAGETIALHDAAQEWPGGAAEHGRLGSFLGTPIVVAGQARGTLCFVTHAVRGTPFTQRELHFAELYAQRIALESAIQREHRDLLEQTRLLEEKNAELNAANEELNQFAYVVSHDLRAPLRAIANLSRWIEDDFDGEMPGPVREHLGLLRSRVARMESLISGILDYSRAGRSTAIGDVDVGALLDEVRDAIDPPPGMGVVADGPLPTVRGDRTQLFQVLSNLVGNAVKYHDRAEGRIAIRARERGDHWQIDVADDGPGIEPRYHEKVFQIFQTLCPRDEHESTGVGLSIVRKIVERAGGRAWIESDGTRGTIVRIDWPKDLSVPLSPREEPADA